MNILTLYALPAATRNALEARHPDWQIVTKETYRPAQAAQIDVILGWNAQAEALIARPNRVRFVQAMSAGVDYLPLKALAEQGIAVANTAGIHAEAIAEYAIGGILSLARGLAPQPTSWDTRARMRQMWTLPHKTAVIFGTGHIGRRIAQHLQAFGVKTLGVSRHGRPAAGFDAVGTDATAWLTEADILVNVLPKTTATTGYFDAAVFAQARRHPLFVNVGRGATVDEAALVAALQNGQLAGAVLDVFASEPLAADHPLWRLPNVLLTPHVAGELEGLRDAVAAIFVANLEAFAATGQPSAHLVDLRAGY